MGAAQGCSVRYWADHPDVWVGFCPNNFFNFIFGRNVYSSNFTLGETHVLTGLGIDALARETVAALLNAAHPDVQYPLTLAEVVAKFREAFDEGGVRLEEIRVLFESFNNMYCPLPE
ncbi:hypothetical protein [Rossellomorea aquimaris]|uniref:Uncharacterized protein n=1 Tax=Rossellomorea aquimaris TaxID=189382 RepID=A0A1J6VZQ4_9BACI|nr:hypothetical protein [Rossellomorea aquimaris]OIU70794.1 hypothetical protein BHE18_19995 [Rossellomorea aquimaris]